MSGFTKFEAAVLEAICVLNPEVAEVLRCQIATAQVTNRENTGGGFYTDVEVRPDTPTLPPVALDDGVEVDVVGLAAPGFGFVIHGEACRVNCLEGFLWGDGDTSDLDLANLDFKITRPAPSS